MNDLDEANYDEPIYPLWQDILMRIVVGAAAVIVLLLIGGSNM